MIIVTAAEQIKKGERQRHFKVFDLENSNCVPLTEVLNYRGTTIVLI